jgi:hypothetical protein
MSRQARLLEPPFEHVCGICAHKRPARQLPGLPDSRRK